MVLSTLTLSLSKLVLENLTRQFYKRRKSFISFSLLRHILSNFEGELFYLNLRILRNENFTSTKQNHKNKQTKYERDRRTYLLGTGQRRQNVPGPTYMSILVHDMARKSRSNSLCKYKIQIKTFI